MDREINLNNEENNILFVKKKLYKIKLDNKKTDENEKISEQELINELNYNNFIIDEVNNKKVKNNAKIMIPQYIIEEQIINREVKEK